MRFVIPLEDCVVLVIELANISTVVVIAHRHIATIAVAAPALDTINAVIHFLCHAVAEFFQQSTS